MKSTQTTLLRTGLITAALITLSACGQKGPLILEAIPVDQTQATLENSIDQIPLETPDQEANESENTSTSTTEAP